MMEGLVVKNIPIKKVYNKITKKDIVEHIYKELLNYNEVLRKRNKFNEHCKIDKRYKIKKYFKKDVRIIIDLIISLIAETLKKEFVVELRGLGTFKPKTTKTEIQDYKLNGKDCKIKIPVRKTVAFKLAKSVKKELNIKETEYIYENEELNNSEITNEGAKL